MRDMAYSNQKLAFCYVLRPTPLQRICTLCNPLNRLSNMHAVAKVTLPLYIKGLALILLSTACLSCLGQNSSTTENLAISAPLATLPQAQENKPKDPALQEYKNRNSECLIHAYSFHWTYFRIISYTDTAYLPCKANDYARLTTGSVLAQMRTMKEAPYLVTLPGIYYPTADVYKSGFAGGYISIGTLRFYPVAISDINVIDILIRKIKSIFGSHDVSFGSPYSRVETRENIYLRWNPGTTVYYLKSPEGKYFVMTSFTSSLIPTNQKDSLNKLAQEMYIPPKWEFNTKVLDKVLEIRAMQLNNLRTTRLRDDFSNLYIEVDEDDGARYF